MSDEGVNEMGKGAETAPARRDAVAYLSARSKVFTDRVRRVEEGTRQRQVVKLKDAGDLDRLKELANRYGTLASGVDSGDASKISEAAEVIEADRVEKTNQIQQEQQELELAQKELEKIRGQEADGSFTEAREKYLSLSRSREAIDELRRSLGVSEIRDELSQKAYAFMQEEEVRLKFEMWNTEGGRARREVNRHGVQIAAHQEELAAVKRAKQGIYT